MLTKTYPSPEQQWCCPGQGVVIEERAVLTLIVHIKVTSRGQRILRAVSRVTQSHSHGTPVVLGYIEEGPPKTDFKKMNRSNNSREEGEKEVEMSY